jgi:NDP-sugar pyrophosphorylase family protein
MRSSGWPVPKPLVRVRGVPLLERNLYPLFRAGFRDIVVSVPADLPTIGGFAASRGAQLASAAGARLRLLEETQPLGNIGCAGQLRGRASTVLVVYSDNLTSLDLRAVLAHHRETGAALTLATHLESFRTPYGELTVSDGRVVDYREKPERQTLVCSAVSVLGPTALAAAAEGAPMGLADLSTALMRRGEEVVEFRHGPPWVDVNDADGVKVAESLVADHLAAFERWVEPPTHVVTCAFVVGPGGVLVSPSHRSVGDERMWILPRLDDIVDLQVSRRRDPPLAEFDDIDEATGRVARHVVLRFEVRAGVSPALDGMTWLPSDRVDERNDDVEISPQLARAWVAEMSHGR